MSFGPYEIVVLIVLGFGWFLGRQKGLAWQLSGIATLALGYAAATVSAPFLARFFPDAWPEDLKRFAAWGAVYALVCAVIYLVTLKLAKKIKEKELEELDRRFGGALGALKAGLLLAVLSLAAIATSEAARSLVKESASGMLLARATYAAKPLLPQKIAEAVARVAGEIAPEPAPAPAPPVAPRPLPAAPRPTINSAPKPLPQPLKPPPATHRLERASPPPPPDPDPTPPPAAKPGEDHEDPMDDDPPAPVDPLAPPRR